MNMSTDSNETTTSSSNELAIQQNPELAIQPTKEQEIKTLILQIKKDLQEINKSNRTQLDLAIGTGEKLHHLRTLCKHGEFKGAVTEFIPQIKYSTANLYMKLASNKQKLAEVREKYPEEQWSISKSRDFLNRKWNPAIEVTSRKVTPSISTSKIEFADKDPGTSNQESSDTSTLPQTNDFMEEPPPSSSEFADFIVKIELCVEDLGEDFRKTEEHLNIPKNISLKGIKGKKLKVISVIDVNITPHLKSESIAG